MTPAILQLKSAGISFEIHRYDHRSDSQSYGLEAANQLNLGYDRVFKTLLVKLSSSVLGVAVIPVSKMLSMPKMAAACGTKKAVMAAPEEVVRRTGYVLGGVSPIGQKATFTTLVDTSVTALDSVFVSAGKRGIEIELAPLDLVAITQAELHSLTE